MCGRYSLALPPSLIRQLLEDDGVPITDVPDDEGFEAPHQSYNFAPGSNGVRRKNDPEEVKYKLQVMKWGIVPSWSRKNTTPTPKAINCRDDSLRTPGGMWQTMKTRKRCIVVAQGFFEWLHVSPKEKVPHFVKRRDGRLMCFAGLWDAIQHEATGDKSYTYSIITTSSNQQLRFLHNRMPVIFDADSKDFREWQNPLQTRWTYDLQSSLKPYEGELEVYPVCKDVGKVGRSSPSFIIPLSKKDNERDISRFFPGISQKSQSEGSDKVGKHENDGDQEASISNAEPSSIGRADAHKKHKISSGYSPPPKRRQVQPGPPGVKKITDFFG
ncbi:hypothetical protein TrVFT333_008852 [Trichoderma virens FT-333]|nr:hypothetical protein TrVFT333_008852 [Trichoderma virens FT-333]